MDEISIQDIDSIYSGCLCSYIGIPVKVVSVGADKSISYINLFTGKQAVAPFSLKHFSAPIGRIGYVNMKGIAVYVSRRPVRKYSVGINSGNTTVTGHIHDDRHRLLDTVEEVKKFRSRAIGLAIMNEYPSFGEALEIAKASEGSCAFDKQFAINKDRIVYFRSSQVGELPAKGKKQQDIKFLKGSEFLSNHLREGYEKTLRAFAAQ